MKFALTRARRMIRHSKLRPVYERETSLYSLTPTSSGQEASHVIMDDYSGFQTQFTSVMESVLKTAVGEATKLFDGTLQQLKAELVHLRQENVDLKTSLYSRQVKTRPPADGSQKTDHAPGPPRCDTGVQCEKPVMVERCCSPAQFDEHPLHLRDSDRLAELCSSTSEDENRQLALLLIKKEPQETNLDDYAPGYFLLKQEGAEPILVRKDPFKNTMERVMIPSTFQGVTRCYQNPKEVTTACTASTTNTVSSNQDSSNNKITQTMSISTFKGVALMSDQETQKISASAKKPTLSGLANSSQPSAAPEVSSSSKPGQMTTNRAHLTAPSVSLQMNQLREPHASVLETSQPPQIGQNMQKPAERTNFSPQQVQCPLSQQNLVTDTCSSLQSLSATPANKRVIPPIDHATTLVSQSSTQAVKPSVLPLEVQKLLSHFSGPRSQRPFSSDQHTVAGGQFPIPPPQIITPANHALNPPFQSPVPPVHSSVLPVRGRVPSVQGLVPSFRGPLPPVQEPVPPVQSSVPPVQSPIPPVRNSIPPIQSLISPVRNSVPGVQSSIPPVRCLVPPIQSPIPPVRSLIPPIQSPIPPDRSLIPPIQSLIPPVRSSISPVQSLIPPVRSSVPPVQSPIPPVRSSIPPIQSLIPPVRSLISSIQSPVPPTQGSVLSIQGPVPTTQINTQSNDILPPYSHFPSVSHNDMAPSTQPSYPSNHIPFAQSSIPVQSMKTTLSPVSIPQTNAPSPQEQLPVTSHYQILPDHICSSTDHFFPSPDNSSDLLQPLPPMPFHSPIVLTQQQAALEQPSMIHSQSSTQPLQLAPLLTLKEQQAAASNQGNLSKRGSTLHVEISVSAVNNFEEHTQRFPPSSPTINCGDDDSITMDMHNEDSIGNDDNSCHGLMSGMTEHYKFLSKPQSNFRMNMSKGSQPDGEVSKQSQSDYVPIGVSPHSSVSAPPPDRGHLSQKVSRRALERNTECSECGRILSNASSLENHMRLHRGERPYNCSQCGKAFPSVRGLNRHVKVHAEEKGYKCEDCGRSFVYQFTLTKHKLIHSGDRPYPCKICGKKFLSKADRCTHMRMHTGEKPFFCNQCGKTFKHRVALNMHVQGHRGEKRYACPHCDKGFLDLGNFKRHKRIHTGEKPFECKECGKRFTQSAHLKKHVNTQHTVSKTS